MASEVIGRMGQKSSRSQTETDWGSVHMLL